MNIARKKELLNYLLGFVSARKKELFEKLIRLRTRYITVVLEDIYQPHNASAVLRSCDCFGIQDVHIIENKYKYEINPDVALGSSKWLTLFRYNRIEFNTTTAFNELRKNGYKIVVTSPHKNDVLLEDLPLDSKTALIFGTELNGLSEEAKSMADGWVKIPMAGFTESLNISVSAAIILHYISRKLRKSDINWQLTEEEVTDIKLEWTRNVIKRVDLLEEEFLKKH